jgi:hypothetical protein
MNIKRVAATISFLGIIASISLTPAPAQADTQEILIISAAVAGTYVGAVLLGTVFFRREDGPFGIAPQRPSSWREQHPPGLRLAPGCAQTSTNLTLLCW